MAWPRVRWTGHRRADDDPCRRRGSWSPADGSNQPRDIGKGPQGDMRRGGQDDYPERKGRVGRGRQGRGRTDVQSDFGRRRSALDPPCRKRQARARDKEIPVGGREMAQVWRHRRAIAAPLSALAILIFAPALAQDPGPKNGTDLYERPVLAVDPGMHTAA